MQFLDIVVLCLYFAAMIWIGIWAMRRVDDQEDYFMGGRGFGKLMQTFAAFGAGTGSHEPVNVGRTAWTSGLSGVWSALMWLFVTPIYWITAVWYRRMRHLTLGDWFVERYESRGLGVAYTLFAFSFYIVYLSTMFSAIANVAAPLMNVDTLFGFELETVLIPMIAIMVIVYGVLGGLTAAYWTDLIQGIFIILLSVLLIPSGLSALVQQFGDPTKDTLMDGFRIMHERVSPDNFSLFQGPSSGEFPIQYIISLTLLGIVGIVVQPHFIATGGGSAKSEDEARIGLVVGNFLKRLCTAGWAITALIALALLAGNVEIAQDPDRVWGVAAREILQPLGLGLVGLMLACLLAALMSSADAYMIVTSGLVARNIYAAYINKHATEKEYVMVGRVTGLIIIVGAAVFALLLSDVFAQFKIAMELPILFAAPFWIGMYWRRANRTATWLTIAFSGLIFFILPIVLPAISPELRTNEQFLTRTNVSVTEFTRPASAADIAKHEAWTAATKSVNEGDFSAEEKAAALKTIGAEPPVAPIGEPITITRKSGGQPIFWRGGITTEENGNEIGQGSFSLDYVGYQLIGYDLSTASKATLETLRLPPRLLTPFLFLIVVSLFTPRNNQEALDRYYAKMMTEVDPDPEADRQKLEQSYSDPTSYRDRLLFPGTDWEFSKPSTTDVVGFLACVVTCFVIVGLLIWLASIGQSPA